VPLDQAEQAKREIDVAAAGHRGSTEGAQQVIWTDLQERDHRRLAAARACVDAVRTFFSERARDLRDHSYLSQTGQIHLVGRAASLAGLPAVLKEVFDLPVVIGTGEKGRAPGDEMEGLLVTGQVRVAAAMRRAQLAEQAGSLTNRASGFWSWLKRPLE
jgi:cell division ATPase FtsA